MNRRFIVGLLFGPIIGGDGGLLRPLFRGSAQRRHDEFLHPDRRSFFHYLRILPRSETMIVETLAVTPQGDSTRNACTLEIPYAKK